MKLKHELTLSERVKKIKHSQIRKMLNKVSELKQKGVEVADFTAGKPNFDTPIHIKDAAKKALDEGLVHYTSSKGRVKLREAICEQVKKEKQLEITPEEVIVTIGAEEALYIASQIVINEGDEVLVPELMYIYYPGLAVLGGARCVTFPLDDNFSLNPEELEKYISPKTKAMILCNPNNPTGKVLNKDCLEKIAKLAKKYNFFIISDEVYHKILFDDIQYTSIAELEGMKERTLIINSLSKTYAMDGWRIGYLITSKKITSEALKVHQHIVNSANNFVQIAARTALTSSQDCIQKMVKEYDRRRQFILSCLDDLKIPYVRPQGAFYVFPFIKKYGMDSEEFSEYLLEKARVAVVPGNAFGERGEGYIRIAFTTSYTEVQKGMSRMKKVILNVK